MKIKTHTNRNSLFFALLLLFHLVFLVFLSAFIKFNSKQLHNSFTLNCKWRLNYWTRNKKRWKRRRNVYELINDVDDRQPVITTFTRRFFLFSCLVFSLPFFRLRKINVIFASHRETIKYQLITVTDYTLQTVSVSHNEIDEQKS